MFVLKKIQDPNNAILLSEDGEEIQHKTSTSVSDPVPTPDFPFQEFPLTEVVTQSQIDFSSISDMSDPRETSNSLRKATKSTDLPLKSGLNNRSHEEIREYRDLTVSEKHTQSSRDSSTICISDNSNPRKSIFQGSRLTLQLHFQWKQTLQKSKYIRAVTGLLSPLISKP